MGREIGGIEPDAVEALEAYHWPGNVRELEKHRPTEGRRPVHVWTWKEIAGLLRI